MGAPLHFGTGQRIRRGGTIALFPRVSDFSGSYCTPGPTNHWYSRGAEEKFVKFKILRYLLWRRLRIKGDGYRLCMAYSDTTF